MGQITLRIPDETLARVEDAFDTAYPGRGEAKKSKPAWLESMLLAHLKDVLGGAAAAAAAHEARTAALAEIDAIFGD